MCAACDDLDIAPPRRFSNAAFAAVQRAERRMPGTKVSDDDWEVFRGRREGALSWVTYQRIAKALHASKPGFACAQA